MTDEIALWKKRILERKANGQTIMEWCREHNVTKGSYHYWRRQVMKVDGNIRFRLRMCIWKQWKTPQNRAKNLTKLGINKYTAWRTAYAGARIAFVCNKGAVNVAINNKRLASFGLISMLDYYTERCVTC